MSLNRHKGSGSFRRESPRYGRLFFATVSLKSCRFHATLARFVVPRLEKLFPWPSVMRMLRSLNSSKLRERAQAAAKHVRGLSPTIEEIVSLHARTRVL